MRLCLHFFISSSFENLMIIKLLVLTYLIFWLNILLRPDHVFVTQTINQDTIFGEWFAWKKYVWIFQKRVIWVTERYQLILLFGKNWINKWFKGGAMY